MRFSSALTVRCCLVCPAAVSLSQIGKFLPNATKEQQAYKEQRQTTMLQQTGQFTMLTQVTKLEDPIAAALAAHGERQMVGVACLAFVPWPRIVATWRAETTCCFAAVTARTREEHQ